MSVVNPFGKLFNRKPADPDAELNPADLAQHPAGGLLADAYQTDGMASVQGVWRSKRYAIPKNSYR